jgi:hypothetical protein
MAVLKFIKTNFKTAFISSLLRCFPHMSPIQEQFTTRQEKKPDIQQKARTLTDDVGELFELYYKLAIVTVTEKASSAVAASLTAMIVMFFFMFSLLFAGLGLGWFLGDVLHSMIAGYLIVAGIFLLLIVITLALRKNRLFPVIRNIIIKKIYE